MPDALPPCSILVLAGGRGQQAHGRCRRQAEGIIEAALAGQAPGEPCRRHEAREPGISNRAGNDGEDGKGYRRDPTAQTAEYRAYYVAQA